MKVDLLQNQNLGIFFFGKKLLGIKVNAYTIFYNDCKTEKNEPLSSKKKKKKKE